MNTKIFKIYIKDNYFIAEEVGGTNLYHAYGSKEVRADVKYTGDEEFTFYQNHSGLAILGMENIPYTNLKKENGSAFASANEVADFIFEFTQNYGGTGGGGSIDVSTLAKEVTLNSLLLEAQKLNRTKTVRLDKISDNLFYVGRALAGTLDDQALWQIIKYTKTGVVLKGEFANGSDDFNQKWDDRLTLNYV